MKRVPKTVHAPKTVLKKCILCTQNGTSKYRAYKNKRAAQPIRMNEFELWSMFAKTGDIEWYDMYRAMKEYEESKTLEPEKTEK